MNAEILTIKLEDIPSTRPTVFVGDHHRESTMTSVVLLNNSRLVACHFNACQMYLIEFDFPNKSFKLLKKIDTLYNNIKCETDLLATNGQGLLVATNFFHNSSTLYSYKEDSISFFQDVPLNIGDHTHGVKFYNNEVIAVTSRHKKGGIHFIDFNKNKKIFELKAPGLSVSDVIFLSDVRCVMISNYGTPLLISKKIYASSIIVIDFDIKTSQASVVYKKIMEASHLDNIVRYQGKMYMTDQYNNKIIVMDENSFAIEKEVIGFDFPHGIDVNFGLMAVTNYGNNTIQIRSALN